MNLLPIFLKLQDRSCLVVGGGQVAARKVRTLLDRDALVTVVTRELAPELAALESQGRIAVRRGEPGQSDLEGMVLVIAATDDAEVNRQVASWAAALGIPANVVDQPELGSFIMPSVIDRAPVQIAISTGGASPVLARLLRARLETVIPAAYGRLAGMMAAYRERARQRFPKLRERRRFWEQVLHGSAAELLLSGHESAARQALERQLDSAEAQGRTVGEVYLVGAGPGDPDLLTFRALRLMQQADVVLYDRLVNPAMLELVRRDAERVFVGKERDRHALPQEEINRLLARLAREGKRVLRLKGGDPFIFGRGGEEIEELAAEGLPFQVVPGITAASGCASYAGIPLTHRDYAQACVFVTGHLKDGSFDLNWQTLVQPRQTVVVYMGLQGIDILCKGLIDHGLAADTPAALVQQGTTPAQKVYTATLAELPGLVERHQIRPPSLIIVGEVVRLHERLAWFEPPGGEAN